MADNDANVKRVLCAHADQNGEGMHWKNEGEPCPLAVQANRAVRRGRRGVRDDNLGGWLRNATR